MQIDSNPETTTMANAPLVRDLPLSELRGRAVGLARRLGQQFHFNAAAWQTHWDDLVQTALLAFLGCHDRPLSHAYTCAHTDLKNYAWVHIRGLNGGWKSLAAREYRLLDGLDEMDETLLAVSQSDHEREHAPRPVEWAVEMREAGGPPQAAALFRHILIILVGLNSANWYPERMYRAALILSLRATGHTWDDVLTAVGDLPWEQVRRVYDGYREEYLAAYTALHPLAQEVIKLRGEMRVRWFEEATADWLNRPMRKIVVFPHGICTLTYREDGRRPGQVRATMQKGRQVDGRQVMRSVNVGVVGALDREVLWQKSLELERKLAALTAETGAVSVGRIDASRGVMFGVI